jgi:hypothetical protein
VLHVRDKHAHSWVEVLLNEKGPIPRWLTLDPTPARQRAAVVAQVGGSSGRLHVFTNPILSFWVFGVAGFDADRQERTIYGPIRGLANEAARGFRVMGQMLRDALKWFYFENAGQFFSVRGFFVSVFAMLILVGLIRGLGWLYRRWFGGKQTTADDGHLADPGVAFYYRLVQALASMGLERPAAETPREFARRATLTLESIPRSAEHSALPPTVIDLFYAKRFGATDPSPESLQVLDDQLTALESSLQGSTTG